MKKRTTLIFLILVVYGVFYFIFYTNVFLKLFFEKKIWVHRINSIEKLKEVKDNFYGVELDVEFIDSLGVFDVNHPPAKSIGLSLEKFFSDGEYKKGLHYWLDFKNLNAENAEKALYHLEIICQKHHVNLSNVIVESGNVEFLKTFQEKGFEASYYLHWPGLHTLDNTMLNFELAKIEVNIRQSEFPLYLSSDYHDYKILKKYFPDKEILLWLDDQFDTSIKNRVSLYSILFDNNVKVILFKHQSETKER